MISLLKKVITPANHRALKSLWKVATQVNELESDFSKLSDAELRSKTHYFKEQISAGRSVNSLMPESFAAVREASKRVLGMRHFDVQLVGGVALHSGMIAEMKTGEGKTLVATLPAYLNAIAGSKVHIVTVNGYLAKRDAEWMGQIYKFLDVSVSCIIPEHSDTERKDAYNSDILYATNNDVGFDYLRDNLKFSQKDMVQKRLDYAIVDEVDSILIDEARTPLIISDSSGENDKAMYLVSDQIVQRLSKDDFELDEKNKSVSLTDAGIATTEELAMEYNLIDKDSSLFDVDNIMVMHYVNQSLKARKTFEKDKDYLISRGQVLIVDEFTGRAMKGRRFSDGLHQAIEAKENVQIQDESKTLASTTFQNYFRLYKKLSGMTGTALTEQSEFWEIYGLEVLQIPTNIEVKRKDLDDEIYRTEREKFNSAIEIIEECYKQEQPILVGTASIEKSEHLSKMLHSKSLPHSVLNARHHKMEAEIIAQAGRPSAITIATNMAGRGTDIKLGGNLEMLTTKLQQANETNPKLEEKKAALKKQIEIDKQKVLSVGGLYVLGTERHESRRIDNQLRGRSGRQGDPGVSKFIISMEDDLLRIFGSGKIKDILLKLGMKEGEAIHHPWISKSLEKAQKKVEARNYDIRKSLIKFDDVINKQRKVIFENRNKIINQGGFIDFNILIESFNEDIFLELYSKHGTKNCSEIDVTEIAQAFNASYEYEILNEKDLVGPNKTLQAIINQKTKDVVMASKKILTSENPEDDQKWSEFVQELILTSLDNLWREHLLTIDALKHGINLRAIGQKNPFNEFQKDAFSAFQAMLLKWREQSVKSLLALSDQAINNFQTRKDPDTNQTRISRNSICPCGSGQRYKYCHGKN